MKRLVLIVALSSLAGCAHGTFTQAYLDHAVSEARMVGSEKLATEIQRCSRRLAIERQEGQADGRFLARQDAFREGCRSLCQSRGASPVWETVGSESAWKCGCTVPLTDQCQTWKDGAWAWTLCPAKPVDLERKPAERPPFAPVQVRP